MNTSTNDIIKILFDIEAIKINTANPFTFSSGLISPIYCDNRLIISYPEYRQHITAAFIELIKQKQIQCDIVVGTATAGIPHAAWLADQLQLPLAYVRSKAKSHGKQNQIEGKIEAGQRALIIEDLISTGSSALMAATALKQANCVVEHCLAIFNYDMPQSQSQFDSDNIQLHCLANFKSMIEYALKNRIINTDDQQALLAWHKAL